MMASLRMLKILFLIATFGCNLKKEKMKDESFNWLPTICAPEKFPVKIMEGSFQLGNGQTVPILPKSYVSNGWGETGAINLIGDENKPLPIELNIQWFAYRERKFYSGIIDIASLKLADYFKEGFLSPVTNKHETYEYIVAGAAPGGGISIWLKGNGITTEVGFFQAKEIHIDTNKLLGSSPNMDTYINAQLMGKFTKQEIAPLSTQNYPLEKWGVLYRELYDWHPTIITSAHAKSIMIYLFNGERIYFSDVSLLKKNLKSPMPRQLTIKWDDLEGVENSSEIVFDEEEIFKTIAYFSKQTAEIKLQTEINSIDNSIKVYVLDNKDIIELKKCIINTY